MEYWALAVPLIVALGGWFFTWRDSRRRDTIDPISAAALVTKQAADTMGELIEPMRQELRRLRVEVMVLREVINSHGLPLPDPSFIEHLVRDLE